MVASIRVLNDRLERIANIKNVTENSRRAFHVELQGDTYVFVSTWKTRRLMATIPASAIPNRRALVNVRKALYLALKMGVQGVVTIKVSQFLGRMGGKIVLGTHSFINGEHVIRLRASRIDSFAVIETLLHELVHAAQTDLLGPKEMNYMYRRFNQISGYKNNPFEVQAYFWGPRLAQMVC